MLSVAAIEAVLTWCFFPNAPPSPKAKAEADGAHGHSLSLRSLGRFLRLSVGISAWKSYDGQHAPLGLRSSAGEDES